MGYQIYELCTRGARTAAKNFGALLVNEHGQTYFFIAAVLLGEILVLPQFFLGEFLEGILGERCGRLRKRWRTSMEGRGVLLGFGGFFYLGELGLGLGFGGLNRLVLQVGF